MASRRSARTRMAVAALSLPLWLGSCDASSGPPGNAPLSEQTAIPEVLLEPAPQPQSAPPARSSPDSAPPDTAVSSGTVPDTLPGASPGSGGAGGGGQVAVPGAAPISGASPSPAPVPSPAVPPSRDIARSQTVTAYYVLLDDGGSGGVRFGCNDSLVGIPHSTDDPAEPLQAAMQALLDGAKAPQGGVYNSLSASALTFLAGSFDGTTVTVYLSGAIRPGGACDIPRVEAQLTQTAVSSVGAIRAEIYVNGVGLAEALSPK